MKLIRNPRFWILVFSGLLSLLELLWMSHAYPPTNLRDIRLTQVFAFTSLIYLYLTLLVGPVIKLWDLKINNVLHTSRRALGVSAFYFALLHGANSFFNLFGGFTGLSFLSVNYLRPLITGAVALLILTILTLTSFDKLIDTIGFPRWKKIQQLVYVAGILILFHALQIGSHFADLAAFIPSLISIAIGILLILEVAGLETKYKGLGWVTVITAGIIGVLIAIPKTNTLSMHSNQESASSHTSMSQYYTPSMVGLNYHHYSVSFNHPDTVIPNGDTKLSFKIFDGLTGEPIVYLSTPYEQPLHLIIVNDSLTYFVHIHPQLNTDGSYSLVHKFPESGFYRAYVDFQPRNVVEQQYGFSLKVGSDNSSVTKLSLPISTDIHAQLISSPTLNLQDILSSQAKLIFKITDSNNLPVSNIEPYLASPAHLILVHKQKYTYLHAHAAVTKPPQPNDRFGPELTMLPMSTYDSLEKGTYQAFLELKVSGKLHLFTFDIDLK